jgi:hypothetical protein
MKQEAIVSFSRLLFGPDTPGTTAHFFPASFLGRELLKGQQEWGNVLFLFKVE